MNDNYHEKQFLEPYRSTVAFDAFLNKYTELHNKKILDIACGGGQMNSIMHKNIKIPIGLEWI